MTTRESAADAYRRGHYRFGDFVLDLETGFLRRNGQDVPLRPKSFDVLTYLVVHHGKLVTKNELVEAVWPDTAVTDNSLSQCLFEIRRALDDDSQTAIRTVARRGYVFDVPVSMVFGSRQAMDGADRQLMMTNARPAARSRRWIVGGVVLASLAGVIARSHICLRSRRTGGGPSSSDRKIRMEWEPRVWRSCRCGARRHLTCATTTAALGPEVF